MARPLPLGAPSGGWTADQVRSGDPVEISEGRRVEVMPTLKGGGVAQTWGAAVISTNPRVKQAGVEIGVSPHPHMLRAPDVSVVSEDGPDDEWEHQAPPLAIEYAGPGQDFTELKTKIDELLAAGTRHLWVVRIDGPRRVEVYEPGQPRVVRIAGEFLHAPTVLDEPLPVEALYNGEVAQGVILRNILRRYGYRDLEAVREEGHAEGRAEGRTEGRTEALRDVVSRQLKRRFPGEDEATATLVQTASADDLLWLTEALLDADSVAALQERLGRDRAG